MTCTLPFNNVAPSEIAHSPNPLLFLIVFRRACLRWYPAIFKVRVLLEFIFPPAAADFNVRKGKRMRR